MSNASWTDPIVLASAGGAWVFPEQGVLYTQSRCTIPTAQDVDSLIDFFLWIAEQLPTAEPPIIVHDWRSIRSVPREVRTCFVRRRRELTTRPKRVIIAIDINPLLRMALRTVALAAQMIAQTIDLDLVDDPDNVPIAASLPLPDPSLHARLRLAWKHAR